MFSGGPASLSAHQRADRTLASPHQQGVNVTNGGIFNRWYRNGTCLAFCLLLLVMINLSVAKSADDDHRHDLDYWIGKLRSDSQKDQHTALFQLHFSGSATLPALPAYEHVIRTSNEENCADALMIVADIGPTAQSALPTVRKALKFSDRNVRRAAAFCVLSVVGEDDEAIAVMSELLRNGNSDNRRDVASDLWVVGIPARGCVSALVEATQDADHEVRRQAAKALGRIGHVPGDVSRGPLKLLLGDETSVLHVDVARSLWQLDEPVPSFLPTLIKLVENSELKPYNNNEADGAVCSAASDVADG